MKGNRYMCNNCAKNCPSGQYRKGCSGTSSGSCAKCTIPANSEYTSQGDVNANNCGWKCKLGYSKSGNTCKKCADCKKDTYGQGGYKSAGSCSCITETKCPTGKERYHITWAKETDCSNVDKWNKRDNHIDRDWRRQRRSLHGSRRRPPPRPPPPPKKLLIWESTGKLLNGKCCLFRMNLFDCKCYRERYKDLYKAFGNDCRRLENHYRKHGVTKREKRIAHCT